MKLRQVSVLVAGWWVFGSVYAVGLRVALVRARDAKFPRGLHLVY